MKNFKIFFLLFTVCLFFFPNHYLFAFSKTKHKEKILSSKKGSIIVFESSKNEDASAIFLINERPGGWRSGKKSPFPYVFVFELAGKASIDSLKFINSSREQKYLGISAKDIHVDFSTLNSGSGFHNLKNFTLEQKPDVQEFKIEEAEARWIRLTIKNNYGNPNYTELMEFEAWGNFDFAVLPVFLNFIWILGAAVILFNFGFHEFQARSTPLKFRNLTRKRSFQRIFLSGLILIAGGVCASVNNPWVAAAAGGITLFLIILFVKKLK